LKGFSTIYLTLQIKQAAVVPLGPLCKWPLCMWNE